MSKHLTLVSLPDDHRAALEATCRLRKVDALEWKRARAFLLPDDGCNPALVCEIPDIGPTVLTEWRFAYAGAGLAFFGLKNYSQRQGHLTEEQEQEQALKARFVEHPARTADEVCVYGLAGFGEACISSGAVRLMRRLGFEYKKPHLTPSQADEAEQAAFIAKYEALMTGLVADEMVADEMVVFSDAVHPEHQSRPAHGWVPKGRKIALKATSGRKRLNIQGALDLETFQFTFVQGEKISAQTTRAMLEKPERNNPTMTTIHVFVDNPRYHHARIFQPWLDSPERRVRLHFLPAYAPHL